jgi:hypothetical protein
MAINQSPEAAINARPKANDAGSFSEAWGSFAPEFQKGVNWAALNTSTMEFKDAGVHDTHLDPAEHETAMKAAGVGLWGSFHNDDPVQAAAKTTTDHNTVDRWVKGQFGPMEEAA